MKTKVLAVLLTILAFVWLAGMFLSIEVMFITLGLLLLWVVLQVIYLVYYIATEVVESIQYELDLRKRGWKK